MIARLGGGNECVAFRSPEAVVLRIRGMNPAASLSSRGAANAVGTTAADRPRVDSDGGGVHSDADANGKAIGGDPDSPVGRGAGPPSAGGDGGDRGGGWVVWALVAGAAALASAAGVRVAMRRMR
jgi:hypothetical protein